MTMSSTGSRVYLWAWTPGAVSPVVAGVLREKSQQRLLGEVTAYHYDFAYARSYLRRSDAVPLSPGMPLTEGWQEPPYEAELHPAVEDALPDSWGQRAILHRMTAETGSALEDRAEEVSPLTYMLQSASDRTGALDFQASADHYVPRVENATLEEVQQAAEAVEAGDVPESLRHAVQRGTSIGGARPKASVDDGQRGWIAKFSQSWETEPSVQWEYAANVMAVHAGIEVPESQLRQVQGKEVLLLRRFDRRDDGSRRMVLSAHTLAHEAGEPRASYPGFARSVRLRSAAPEAVGPAVFDRAVFNIAVFNDDDHDRNHAAFWDGRRLELTPAYDLAPQADVKRQVSQRLPITASGSRASDFATLISAHADYGISRSQAAARIERIIAGVEGSFGQAADRARLTARERERLRSVVLRKQVFDGMPKTVPVPKGSQASRRDEAE